MANNNESINIENTATESLLLNEPQANSTPIINSKVSLEDLFLLMKIQNKELKEQSIKLDVKFDELKNEIKKRNFNVDKRINEIELENKKVIDKLELNKDDKVSSSGNDLSLIHILHIIIIIIIIII